MLDPLTTPLPELASYEPGLADLDVLQAARRMIVACEEKFICCAISYVALGAEASFRLRDWIERTLEPWGFEEGRITLVGLAEDRFNDEFWDENDQLYRLRFLDAMIEYVERDLGCKSDLPPRAGC